MVLLLSFWLLSAITLHCSISLTVAKEVFVRPSENVTCSSQSPCLTLNEYAREADKYFRDNTTFIFLPGVHHLDLQLNLESLSNLTFLGSYEEEVTQILFSQRVNLTWTNCVNIEIINLVFVINGLSESKQQLSALAFLRSKSILSKLTLFGDGVFRAIFVNDLSEISISDVHISRASSDNGSALLAVNSTVKFYSYNTFINNTATYEGGAIALYNCTSNFEGNISFIDNTANNTNYSYGGAVFISGGSHNIFGNISFDSNRARIGGAMALFAIYYLSICTCTLSGNINFLNNKAHYNGGPVHGGGAIYTQRCSLNVSGYINFVDNSARAGGALDLNSAKVNLSGKILFISNTADIGGAVAVRTYSHTDPVLNLTGLVSFVNNSAIKGGAMGFDGRARLLLSDPVQVEFIENHADSTGGAMYFDDSTLSRIQCEYQSSLNVGDILCFIQLNSETATYFYNHKIDTSLNFYRNTAGLAGTVLYGGGLNRCTIYTGGGVRDSCGNIVGGSYSIAPLQVIKSISNITSSNELTSEISSDPLKVCHCADDGKSECDEDVVEIHTVPGRKFTFKAVVVGQNNGIVPSSVRISLDNDVQLFNATQLIQETGKECTELTYRLLSRINTTNVTLFPDNGTCRGIGTSHTTIQLNFLPCPEGFTQRESECVCEDRLQQFNVTCNVERNSTERNSNSFWMGTVYENKTYVGLMIHSGDCPLDFCIETPVNITLDNLDVQCNHNHSGTLCGPCKENHSIALGTLHCLDCSNAYLALILPFALAGVVLVAVLLLLNLSVAVGTVNGLIFYANVVQVNRSIFFPLGETNILTVFIAWLNLDLGIETCFYDGMDAYTFTWLQFLFPLYVWILIGLIIIASRYSRMIAQSLGNNPVPTLATLFLLSYSKILRNILAALSVTNLEYPNDKKVPVWLYDGSVPFFQRADHIILVIFAVSVLLLLFLPYTLLLLFGQCFQAYSHHKMLSWMNKIKPFMDAYHAPYKKETRYWTGLILLVRCVLFLIFAVNSLQVGDNHFDLIFTTTVTSCLAGLAWIQNGVYEKVHNKILEALFIVNLCIFSAATFHVKETGGNQAAVSYTSVGIAFATFILIFLYHVYLLLSKASLWMKLIHFMKDNNYRPVSNLKSVNGNDGSSDGSGKSFNLKGATAPVDVPTTVVELREPLLTPGN